MTPKGDLCARLADSADRQTDGAWQGRNDHRPACWCVHPPETQEPLRDPQNLWTETWVWKSSSTGNIFLLLDDSSTHQLLRCEAALQGGLLAFPGSVGSKALKEKWPMITRAPGAPGEDAASDLFEGCEANTTRSIPTARRKRSCRGINHK